MSRREVRLAGTGGQGLILAGLILAEAALSEGHHTVQTQAYGPQSRGGASKAEVIIDLQEIDYPHVAHPGVVLAMSQEACDLYHGDLDPAGVLVADTTFVHRLPEVPQRLVAEPITRRVLQEVGRAIVANISALGLVVALTGVVSRESLTRAVRERAPHGTVELNLAALKLGFRLAEGKEPVAWS
ncbi:MAG: 2-oxoacid:acceptor oxidoreductase family protein [Thermaerobacter sp.]|nr:2-oxoacid:acceptor oxidoreductase family protein [Thermaerobacter sp.]MDA8146673.1 2-oxoacid:acceptor oxidoreductase family protein [Thermaerobacter sp.]